MNVHVNFFFVKFIVVFIYDAFGSLFITLCNMVRMLRSIYCIMNYANAMGNHIITNYANTGFIIFAVL